MQPADSTNPVTLSDAQLGRRRKAAPGQKYSGASVSSLSGWLLNSKGNVLSVNENRCARAAKQ